jgi:CBS domain-containing protein
MQVAEIMTRDVQTVSPTDTIQHAAATMDALNVGAVPVCDGKRLVGMLTDRDITVRATAADERPSECRVGDIMTEDVQCCYENDDIEEAIERMKSVQVRRMPVVNRNKEIVGMVSLGDLATRTKDTWQAADTLQGISDPSEPDRSGRA